MPANSQYAINDSLDTFINCSVSLTSSLYCNQYPYSECASKILDSKMMVVRGKFTVEYPEKDDCEIT